MSNTFADVFQTPYHELTAGQKHTHQTYLDFERWMEGKGPFDPGHASRGEIAFEGGVDGGYEYFSTDSTGDRSQGAGLYDDYGGDYHSYPWAYPEHPDFKNWWGGGGGGPPVEEKAPEKAPPVFDALEISDFSTKQSDDDDILLRGTSSENLTSFIPQPTKIDESSSVSVVDQLRNANAGLQSVVGNEDLARSFVNRVLSSANRSLRDSEEFVGGSAIKALRAGTFQAPQAFQAPQQAPQASTGTESKIENILVDVTSEQDPLEQIIEQTPDFKLVTDVDGAADDGFDQSGGAFSEGESSSPTISGRDADAFSAAEGGLSVFGNFAHPNLLDFEEPFFDSNVKVTKADALAGVAKGVGKGFVGAAGFGFPGKSVVGALVDVLSGKNPEDIAKDFSFDLAGGLLTGPMGPIAVPIVDAAKTGVEIAQSPYSGFGFGHFGAGFLSNLTGFLGTSIDDQERLQEIFEENIEDYFTYTGSPKPTEPPEGYGFVGGRFADDWSLQTEKQTPIKDIQKEIDDARRAAYDPFDVPTESAAGPGSGPTAGVSFSDQSVGIFGLDDGNWFDDDAPPFVSDISSGPFGGPSFGGPSGGSSGGDPDAEPGDPI